MVLDFESMLRKLQADGPKVIAVGAAEDRDVLLSVEEARQLGIARAILTGNKEKIKAIARENGIDPANYTIVDESHGAGTLPGAGCGPSLPDGGEPSAARGSGAAHEGLRGHLRDAQGGIE